MNEKVKKRLPDYLVLIYLAFSFVYILFVVQPFLYAHQAQSPFLFTNTFFSSFLQFPGEPAEYVANFIMQFFFKPVSGTIVFAIMALLQFFLAFSILKSISKSHFSAVYALIPFLFSIVLANNYNLPYSIEVSISLIMAFLLLLSFQNKTIFRIMFAYFLGAISIYYIAGSGYFLLFTFAAALLSFRLKIPQRAIFLIMLAAFAFALPYFAAHFLFALPPKQHFFYFFPPKAFFMDYKPSIVFIAYLASVPVFIILGLVLKAIETKDANKTGNKKQAVFQSVALLTILAFLFFVAHRFSFQPDEKKKAAADYYCYTNNPEKTVANAKTLKEYNFKANVNYNLVMSKTGQITEKAFNFLQITGSDALHPDIEFQAEMSFVAADFYYNLGFATEARHWAYETLVFYPNNRRTLQLLVKIHLVTGEYKAAHQYLDLLKTGIGSKKFIREFEPVVNDSTSFRYYPALVEKRSFIPAENELNPSIEERLKQLLAANPKNKKAYEFLMLYYLMESDAEKFVEFYKNAGQYFTNIPEVYEEALLLFGEKYELPAIKEFQVSNETKTRFQEFRNKREQYKNSTRTARNMLYKDFGSSFLYYREFVYPHVKKSDIVDDDSDYPPI